MRRLIRSVRLQVLPVALLFGALVLSACSDDDRSITAPAHADQALKPPGGGGTVPDFLQQWLQQFSAISAGERHTCAMKNSGAIYCWGGSWHGQAGPANGTCSSQPCVTVPTYITSAGMSGQMDAGYDHTCMIDGTMGQATCWGDNGHGELGVGTYKAQNPSPLGVIASPSTGALVVFSSISAGKYSTCGTAADGVYCWGIMAGWVTAPTRQVNSAGFIGATVGYQHACAIFTGNGAREPRCWGANELGSAGQPIGQWDVPPTANAGLGANVNRVTTAVYFTCADQSNGTVQCMGDNLFGQLANGSSGERTFTNVPQTVAGMLSGVSTSSNHACALDPTGHAFCWGAGADGQLGNGVQALATSPQAVNTTMTFRAIAAGDHHTCAIGTDNRIYCWGSNTFGQLGNGSTAGGIALAPQPTL